MNMNLSKECEKEYKDHKEIWYNVKILDEFCIPIKDRIIYELIA